MDQTMKGLIIGLDFDGTVVSHEYPNIGKDLPHCIDVLHRCINSGAKICLNTMRSGKELDDAVAYLLNHGIELYGINCNPDQYSWSKSPKVYAHKYIDDAAVGCPTMQTEEFGNRPFVDWVIIEQLLFCDE